jgi:hypothetical protein
MRSLAIMIPSAINPSPTTMISTSIVSHRGICFEVFMVLRLLARHIVDRSGADRGKADHTPQHEGVTAMCVPLRTAFSFHHHRKQHDRLQSLARAQEAPTSNRLIRFSLARVGPCEAIATKGPDGTPRARTAPAALGA